MMWIAQVLGVDRGVARGAGGEEERLVALGDVELHRVPAWRHRHEP